MRISQLFTHWTKRLLAPGSLLKDKYDAFKQLLDRDKRGLELITELEQIYHGQMQADWARVAALVKALRWTLAQLTDSLAAMHPGRYTAVQEAAGRVDEAIEAALYTENPDDEPPYVLSLEQAAQSADGLELSGGKAHNLGVMASLGHPVPPGFVITTRAATRMLAPLRDKLDELLAQIRLDEPDRVAEVSAECEKTVRSAPVPDEIAEVVQGMLNRHAGNDLMHRTLWAVRSSATHEDGELSFAGQYESKLNICADDVLAAWREVLASKYSPRAIAYRVRHGLTDGETPMGVAVIHMIAPCSSGVVYTRDPGGRDRLVVYSVAGSGEHLVDGSTSPDMYYCSRPDVKDASGEDAPVEILRTVIQSTTQEGISPIAGCDVLSEDHVRQLAHRALQLERHYGEPQDIEWCVDKQGELFLVQTRPLSATSSSGRSSSADDPLAPDQRPQVDNPVLAKGGTTASAGIGIGRTFRMTPDTDLTTVPSGSILLAASLSPDYASLIGRIAGVIAASGSPASHMASVSREASLPVLVADRTTLAKLPDDTVLTLDARDRVVYEGEAEELAEVAKAERSSRLRASTPLRERMGRIMELVSPLTLTDPDADTFTPDNAVSVHDVIRYCHEMGTREMFSLVEGGRGLAESKKLQTDLPFTLYVLDIEDGMAPSAKNKQEIALADLTSQPMCAVWQGLTHPDTFWHKGLKHMDWEAFDRSAHGIIDFESKALASYAVLSRDYLHLMIRFGYHFAVVDTLAASESEKNYVAFRFKGGGADFSQRIYRLEFIDRVLRQAGFAMETRGDMMDARHQRADLADTLHRLYLVGVLLGQTRLLDAAMTSSAQAEHMADEFVQKYLHGDWEPGACMG